MSLIHMRNGKLLDLLNDFASTCLTSNMRMVEVGSYAGRSASVFCRHVRILYCVDAWSPYDPEDAASDQEGLRAAEEQFDRLAVVWPNITKLKMTSLEAAGGFADRSIDALYLDGDHRYEAVLADLKAWIPKIKVPGIVAGHDYGSARFPGVKQAVDEILGPPHYVDAHQNWYIKLDEMESTI